MVAGIPSIPEEAYLNIVPYDECTGCSACINSCPVPCIAMHQDRNGFRYPYVDLSACIRCGKCYSVCPVKNEVKMSRGSHIFYACKHKDDNVRNDSSSGGFFYELARHILSKGGVVFGAAFTEDYHKVIHIHAQSLKELIPIRVSKYLQSEVDQSFPEVKEFLKNNKFVLFSGTPCQIAGLQSYLGNPSDHLVLAEVVCHGVPSPKVWDIYLSGLENKHGSKVKFVTFRDKSKSWRNSDFLTLFENGEEFRQPNSENPYMKAFLRNLSIRPSCTNCRFKKFTSGADLTMGDFWGSTELGDSYNDDIGISVVALNTLKGRIFFDSAKDNLTGVVKLSEKQAFVFNESYRLSASKNEDAGSFFSFLSDYSFPELVSRFASDVNGRIVRCSSLATRIKRLLFKIFK